MRRESSPRESLWRVSALLVVVGALCVVVVTEIAVTFACEEREPCEVVSAPLAMRATGWLTLTGVLASLAFAALRVQTAAVVIGLLTGAIFIAWLLLFAYVGQGGL